MTSPGSRTIADVFVSVRPDTSHLGPELQQNLATNPSIKRAGDSAGKSFGHGFTSGAKALIAGAASVLVSQKLINGVKQTVTAASDLNETVSKSKNVFGPAATSVAKFSQNSAKAFGISQSAALAATAQFGDMFIQLGFTQKQSAKTSTSLIKTAADLGSFHNVDPSDVLQRIQASFRGEYDSLQTLIPNINAARVEQEALAETHKKSAKDLTAAEKATATLAIIQRDGKNAANDFAETSGGLANQQRILAAQTEDLKGKIGQALLPAMATAARVINTQFLPPIAEFVGKHGPEFGRQLGVIADEKLPKFAKFLREVAVGAKAVFDLLVKGDFTKQFRETFNVEEDSPVVDFLFKIRENFIKAKDAVGPFFASLAHGDTSKLTGGLSSLLDSAQKLGPVIRDFVQQLPAVSDVVNVSATAFEFLAKHTELLRKLMPLLAGGFIALKVAQGLAHAAAIVALPTKISEVIVNRQLVKSNRELVASRVANTGATVTESVATEVNTGAKSSGIIASIRERAATVLTTAAKWLATAATTALTVATRLLGAAIKVAMGPVGWIILGLSLLAAGLVYAYKHSETFRAIVDASFRFVWDTIKAVWNWVKTNWPLLLGILTGPIGLAVVVIVKHWDTIKAGAKKMWDGIQNGALTAISFVLSMIDKFLSSIQTTLEFMGRLPGPFGAPFRAMAGQVQGARDKVGNLKKSIDSLKPKVIPVTVAIKGVDVTALPINQQRRFGAFDRLAAAYGGWIPGVSTGDRADNIPAMLTAGEYVIQRPTARKLQSQAPGFLDSLNAGRLDIGGDAGAMAVGVGRPLRFAAGGSVAAVQRWIKSTDPLPYIWGGAGPGGFDCSGLVGAVYGKLTGKGGGNGQRYFTTDSIGAAQGWRPGVGAFTAGVTPGRGHMAGQLGSLKFEARSTASGIIIGPAASSPTTFARKFYLPAFGGTFGGDPGLNGGQIRRVIAQIRPQIVREMLRNLGVSADNGGSLVPGWNPPIYNGTGRLETVRTAGQEDSLAGEIRSLRVALASQPVVVTLDSRPIARAVRQQNTRNIGGW